MAQPKDLNVDIQVKCGENHDLKNYGKASLRFQSLLKVHGLPHGRPEPKRRHCTYVLPSPFNRLGRPLNYRYIHFDLAPNLAKDGFNPNRPTPGLVAV